MLRKKEQKILNLFFKFNIFCSFFLVPFSLSAQIIFSEVMYNPDGSDKGKEWIEIYNNGEKAVDLIDWKLFEADTNHKIKPLEDNGSLSLPAGSYAIIVDNVDKFKENYPNFLGQIFDSVYSLSNTGEELILRDSELNDISSFKYSSDLGANGDGNSLQLVNSAWEASPPTLGGFNNSGSNQNQVVESPIKVSSAGTPGGGNDYVEKFKIFADAGEDRKVVVGADTFYKAKALGIEKKPLKNARYVWTFGDGSIKEGQNILYSYSYPGEYVVVLNVSSGEYTASDRILVNVLPADVVISDAETSFIELENKSSFELDLSWWRIRSGKNYFTLPKNTIIACQI